MRRVLSPLALVAATALLSSFLFPAAPSTSPAAPSLAQRATSARQPALPDEGELLAWVVETAVREVDAGAPSTAASTLEAALSRPWWTGPNQARLELLLATCLVEVSQQARERDDPELHHESLDQAAVVMERCSLPLAFDNEAARVRLAVHSLRGDQLLAATAMAQVAQLDPALAQEEVAAPLAAVLAATGKLISYGWSALHLYVTYLEVRPHAEAAFDLWNRGERQLALQESLPAAVKALPSPGKLRKGAKRVSAKLQSEYGAQFFSRFLMQAKSR